MVTSLAESKFIIPLASSLARMVIIAKKVDLYYAYMRFSINIIKIDINTMRCYA